MSKIIHAHISKATLKKMSFRWLLSVFLVLLCSCKDIKEPVKGEMAGYLLAPQQSVPANYNAGFSMYVAAWPLLNAYPGNRFQTGLFGTWMFAQNDRPKPVDNMYSDIEGGLGWWRDTRFATETPKFIMGGVALNFSAWANGPGAGKGRDWSNPQGKYGVAQLSPWVLWPPDGLNLKQGTRGELFGYGYFRLPLTSPKSTTAGANVPTGNHCWTLILNTGNFKGPVAFFTPYFFSQPTIGNPALAGMFLDSRPSNPNRALQMETQYIPGIESTDKLGRRFARIAPTSFPRTAQGHSAVVHQVTDYNEAALWTPVTNWFNGGSAASGVIASQNSTVHVFPGHGGATWEIYTPNTAQDRKVPIAWDMFATTIAPDPTTFGYRWNDTFVTTPFGSNNTLATLPQFYQQVNRNNKTQWAPVQAKDVPLETGLLTASFSRADDAPPEPYVTPDDVRSSWKTPGPVAGPFKAYPGDGSVVTYYWYRFADQPALLNADLTNAERERLQTRVVKLHQTWKKDRDYIAPPKFGKLANLDPALVVTPPPGFEVGYVPIVTRQEARQ